MLWVEGQQVNSSDAQLLVLWGGEWWWHAAEGGAAVAKKPVWHQAGRIRVMVAKKHVWHQARVQAKRQQQCVCVKMGSAVTATLQAFLKNLSEVVIGGLARVGQAMGREQ